MRRRGRGNVVSAVRGGRGVNGLKGSEGQKGSEGRKGIEGQKVQTTTERAY